MFPSGLTSITPRDRNEAATEQSKTESSRERERERENGRGYRGFKKDEERR